MSKLPHCLSILVLFFLNKRQIKIGKLISVQTNCLWACSLLLQLFLCFNTSRLQAFSACKPHAQQFVNTLKSFCLNVRSLKLIFLITYNTIQYTTRLGFHCLRAGVSHFLCCTRKRDVCVTPSLIVFQRPAGRVFYFA